MMSSWILGLISVAGVASEIRLPEPQPLPIVGGRTLVDGEFDAVVIVLSDWGSCSGVLIHPRVVATAAHCLGGNPDEALVTVLFTNDLLADAEADTLIGVQSSDWHVDPRWCSRHDTNQCTRIERDIAIVVLPNEVPITPIPPLVHQRAWNRATAEGATLKVVGFGGDLYGVNGEFGVKRAASVPFVRHYRQDKVLFGERGASVTFGDSGGPVLALTADGHYEVLAITSYATTVGNPEGWASTLFPTMCWIRDVAGVEFEDLPDDWTCAAPILEPELGCSIGGRVPNWTWTSAIFLFLFLRRRRAENRPTCVRRAPPCQPPSILVLTSTR